MPVVSGSSLKSGILSLPGKVQRSRFDTDVSATPRIVRGVINPGTDFASPYNDNKTEVFTARQIIAGATLPSGSLFLSQIIASPNIAPDIIINAGFGKQSIESQTFFIDPYNLPAAAFNDSRVSILAGASGFNFYSTGTDVTVNDGFSSPLSSKLNIVIELPNSEDRVLGRYGAARGDAVDPAGEFAGQDLTGFVYYSQAKQRWEQIGLNDPATGQSIKHDYAVEIANYGNPTSREWLINSGTNNYPMQFKPAQGSILKQVIVSSSDNGGQKVGLPTIASMAPFKTTYHATASQVIEMQQYIQKPFLLEKAVLELPFTARHKYDGTLVNHSWAHDNYTFFVYRQFSSANVNGQIDTPTSVSSSIRYIVASASLAIYNENGYCLDTDIMGPTTGAGVFSGFLPPNGPAQSFNLAWNASSPGAGNTPDTVGIASVTGTIRLEIVPAVAPPQDLGLAQVPSSRWRSPLSPSKPGVFSYATLGHQWPGGTTVEPFFELSSGYTGKSGLSASYCFTASNAKFYNPRTFIQFPESRNLQTFFGQLPIQKNDPRSFRPYGGTVTTFSTIGDDDIPNVPSGSTVGISGENSVISPYLLLPTDELVLGFDAGIGQPMFAVDASSAGPTVGPHSNVLTSSFLTLKAGTGKLTLFGSLVSNEVEYFPTANQDLLSVDVQEALLCNCDVLDQFNIAADEEFTGSMQEEVVGGGYGIAEWDKQFSGGTLGDRRVIATRSKKTLGSIGSLERFDRLISQTEIFVDTSLPNTAVFRFDRHGQLRDMLEQPLDGAFKQGAKSKLKTNLSNPPVNVRFFRNGVETDPENTFSQNLSSFATSSIIYKDISTASTLASPLPGQDRPDIPDAVVNESIEII